MPSIAARRSASIVSCGKPARRSAHSSARDVLPGRHDLVHQPDAVRLVRVNGPPGEDQLERAAEADDPRQPLRAAVDQRHAPAALEQAESRALGGDAQVAPQRKLDAARQAPARDRRDRRLLRHDAGEAHRAFGVVGLERRDRLEIGARAEGDVSGAGQDHHARVVVGLERSQRLAERLRGRPVDGVAALRAVDRHHGGAAGALVADGRARSSPDRICAALATIVHFAWELTSIQHGWGECAATLKSTRKRHREVTL